MSDYSATHRLPTRSEWASIGVRFFSWVAGIALVLSGGVPLRLRGGRPWLRAGLGLGTGVALVVVAERWIAAKYRITGNAVDAAGIGIVYATLYAMHARWALVPLVVAFIGMLLVTVAAVALATRRDSMFVAILGLLGGFGTAFLLSSTGNYPLAVFSYLLALNIGIAWLAARRGWWLLSALSAVLTALYEWGWTLEAVNVGLLPLAAAIFAVFAVVGTVPLWYGRADDRPAWARWIAAAAAHLPLLFAVYVAAHLNYGPQYNVLFLFLLIVDAGLLAMVGRGGPKWLHAAGGVATLVTFGVWLGVSYTHASWPWLLLWLAVFVALYLVEVTPFAGLLFGVFIGVALREPQQWVAIIVAMLAMLAIVLVVAIRNGRPVTAAMATAMSCITLMMLHPPVWTLITLHALLFSALFAVAWMCRAPRPRHSGRAVLRGDGHSRALAGAVGVLLAVDTAGDRHRTVPPLRRLSPGARPAGKGVARSVYRRGSGESLHVRHRLDDALGRRRTASLVGGPGAAGRGGAHGRAVVACPGSRAARATRHAARVGHAGVLQPRPSHAVAGGVARRPLGV